MKRLSFILLSVLLIGCGGGGGSTTDGGSTTGGNTGVLASVAIFDGNSQTATVGTELAEPLVALLLNQSGLPITGLVVNFKVVTGGGSVFAGAAISDNNGIVREHWTLGTIAGPQKVEVRAVDSSGTAVVFATFEATAVADAPTSVSIASGNNQSTIQLQPLPIMVKVVVRDTYGNPVPGVEAAFTANNGGTAFPGTAMTNAAGEAQASWTLGLAIGGQTLDAVVAGFSPVRFNSTATQAPPTAAVAIIKYSGDLISAVQHTILPGQLQALVTDNLGNGVPGIQVIFSAAAGSGYITPTTVITDGAGKASWRGYFHTAGLQKVDAVAAGTLITTFDTNVTPLNHPFDGEYKFISSGYGTPSMHLENGGTTGGDFPPNKYILGGAFNETNGMLTNGQVQILIGRVMTLSGQLTLDSLNRATGAGTWIGTIDVVTGNTPTGTWTCERL